MSIWREWTGGETEGTRLPKRAKQQAMQNAPQDDLVTTMENDEDDLAIESEPGQMVLC